MFNLPKTTELSKQLPKKAIYAKFKMAPAAKEKFDGNISRISIINEISQQTIPTLKPTEEIKAIYVLLVSLKKKDFDERAVAQVSKLIDQNMILALEFEDNYKLAIYHTRLIQSDWKKLEDIKLNLYGLNIQIVWENLVKQIGDIEISEGNTLDEQIIKNEEKVKILAEIEKLEKQAKREQQPKKKFELSQRIHILQSTMEDM